MQLQLLQQAMTGMLTSAAVFTDAYMGSKLRRACANDTSLAICLHGSRQGYLQVNVRQRRFWLTAPRKMQ